MKKIKMILLFAVMFLASYAQSDVKTEANESATSTVDEKQEKLSVIIPKGCKIGEEFEMKLIYNSSSSIKLAESTEFLIIRKSSSASIKNDIITHEDSYTIQAIRDGVYQIDKVLFESIPEGLIVDPIPFEVKY